MEGVLHWILITITTTITYEDMTISSGFYNLKLVI
jgi:hypothetical protein